MAISSNRSVSPISNRSNPKSRTPESNNSIRRSFSGNFSTRPSIVPGSRSLDPFTPSDLGQKENEKDHNLNQVRMRSPAVSKGTKHFMVPTISAASKIASSPRKKPFVERNEPVRTSVSISDGKSTFLAVNQSEFMFEVESPNLDSVSKSQVFPGTFTFTPTPTPEMSKVPTTPKRVTFSDAKPLVHLCIDSQETVDEPLTDMKNMGSKVSPSCSTSLDRDPLIPPCDSKGTYLSLLDHDPYIAPYDPKNNYLSPRPQFLHYRPNPRIGVHLGRELEFDPGESKGLDESFSSESCSDSESSEETQSSEFEKESEEFSDLDQQVEDASSDSIPHGKRYHLLSILKSIPLLLVIVVTCLTFPLTDLPVIPTPIFKEQTYLKFDNYAELGDNFKLWSAQSLSYLSHLLSPPIVEESGLFHFMNFTDLDKDFIVDMYQPIDFVENETEVEQEDNGAQLEISGKAETEQEEERDYIENGVPDKVKEDGTLEFEGQTQISDSGSQIIDLPDDETQEDQQMNDELEVKTGGEAENEVKEEQDSLEIEEVQSGMLNIDFQNTEETVSIEEIEMRSELLDNDSQINVEPASIEEIEVQPEMLDIDYQTSVESASFKETNIECVNSVNGGKSEFEEQPHLVSQAPEAKREMLEATEFSNEKDIDSISNIIIPKSELNVLFQNSGYLLVASVLLTVIATTVALLIKRKSASTAKATILEKELPLKEVISNSIAAGNWATEVEMFGHSGPVETSMSFQHSSSNGKLSKLKRESLESSSEYSATTTPSYGSFTTYEKIHSKRRSREEDVVTPVRRSSRILNKATSP